MSITTIHAAAGQKLLPEDFARGVAAAHARVSGTTVSAGTWATGDLTFHAASTAEVDAIAAQWEVAARWNHERTHYTAIAHDGPVECRAVYVTPERMAAWTARIKDAATAGSGAAA